MKSNFIGCDCTPEYMIQRPGDGADKEDTDG